MGFYSKIRIKVDKKELEHQLNILSNNIKKYLANQRSVIKNENKKYINDYGFYI